MGEKYNYDVSKAHDTVFYMTAYFYDDDIFTRFRKRFGDIDDAVHPYYVFKEKHKNYAIPSEIIPFVYIDRKVGMQSFLIHYLNNNLEHITGTKEDALDLIKNGELLKRQLLEHILPSENNSIIDQLIERNTADNILDTINNLPYSSNTKIHIAFLILDFNKYHNILIKVYKSVYDFVDELYSENQETINEIKRLINDESYNVVERFKSIFKMPNNVSSFSYYISLLNGFLGNYRKKKKEVCFGLGLHFRITVEALQSTEQTSSLPNRELTRSEVYVEIVELFTKYKGWAFSVTDIAHHLGLAKHVVYPHINEMLLLNIIRYSNSNETDIFKVYYRLNY